MNNIQFNDWYKSSGLSQRQAAVALGTSQQQIFRWLHGQQISPAWQELIEIRCNPTKSPFKAS